MVWLGAPDQGASQGPVRPVGFERERDQPNNTIMVNVKKEHYYHEKALSIEYTELFQLYNQDALDKSIVGCYCL